MNKKTFFKPNNVMRALFFFLSISGTTLACADIAIIVNPNNTDVIEEKDINRLFLAKVRTFPSGKKATPIDQIEGTNARRDFLNNFLGKSEDQLRSYWARLIFTGRVIPPKTADNDEAVKQLVAQHPELIGYISSSSVDDSVRVIATY